MLKSPKGSEHLEARVVPGSIVRSVAARRKDGGDGSRKLRRRDTLSVLDGASLPVGWLFARALWWRTPIAYPSDVDVPRHEQRNPYRCDYDANQRERHRKRNQADNREYAKNSNGGLRVHFSPRPRDHRENSIVPPRLRWGATRAAPPYCLPLREMPCKIRLFGETSLMSQ